MPETRPEGFEPPARFQVSSDDDDPCAQCGEHHELVANWPDGKICAYCYQKSKRTTGTCRCGHAGVLPGKVGGAPACRTSQRADWLAEQAAQKAAPWYETLETQLTEQTPDEYRVLIREIASYRERYGVRGAEPLGPVPPTRELEQSLIRSRLTGRMRSAATGTASLRSIFPAGVDHAPQITETTRHP